MAHTPLTQHELARKAGYSRFTVSKALAGHPSVPVQTRDRILGVAHELGYRPNAAAKAMKSGRFNAAALVYYDAAGDRNQLIFPPLINGLSQGLIEADMHLTFSAFNDRHLDSGADGIKVLRELMVDGVIVNYDSRHSRSLRGPLRRLRVPAVWVNDRIEHDCVYPDDVQAGRMATQRLLSRGHRRVALWQHEGGKLPHYSSSDRAQGYADAMRQSGLTPCQVSHRSGNAERQADAMAWLAAEDRPTAVVTIGSDDAIALLIAASQCGLRVPDDLSVITIDTRMNYVHVPIETVRIPFANVGREAVKMLLEKIDHPGRASSPVAVPYMSLDEGPTVGPCVAR